MSETIHRTWFHRLLFSPFYRKIRLSLLCVLMFLFSFSEMGYHFTASASYGNQPLFFLCLAGMICKIIPIFLLIQVVIPRLLPQRRYRRFWTVVFATLFLSILLQHFLEISVYRLYQIPFWRPLIGMRDYLYYALDLSVQLVQWLIVLMGVSLGYLLKYWLAETQRKQQAESSRLQMESELLKEQVSPDVLCETLHQSGELAVTNPTQASERLMLLSRLLRYQLYDCRRSEVLLDGEIKFLQDYLRLLQLNGSCGEGTLQCVGRTLGILVPPLLFVSFVQPTGGSSLHLLFEINSFQPSSPEAAGEFLRFEVKGNCRKVDLDAVRRRLEHLYPQRYKLLAAPDEITFIIQSYGL